MGIRWAASLMVLSAQYACGFAPGFGHGAALRITRSRGMLQRCSPPRLLPALRSTQGGKDDDGRKAQTPVSSVWCRGVSTALLWWRRMRTRSLLTLQHVRQEEMVAAFLKTKGVEVMDVENEDGPPTPVSHA